MTTSSNTNLNSLNEELNTASKELEARKVALLKDGVQIVLEEILNCIDPLNLDFNTHDSQGMFRTTVGAPLFSFC